MRRVLTAMYRDQFLIRRKKLIEQAEKEAAKESSEIIHVMDPGDEIICDVCNGEILGEIIASDGWGAYCDECIKQGRRK